MTAEEVLALIKASGRRWYVYVLSRPDGSPFYVGVGTKRRILDHRIYARRPAGSNSRKLNVIRKVWRAGGEIAYAIAAFFDERVQAEAYEVQLIAEIGRRDLGTGPLCNQTDGGEGAPTPSEEVIRRRSDSLRKAWAKRDLELSMLHLRDPAVRCRAVKSRTGRKRGPNRTPYQEWRTAEQREAMSKRLKSDPISKRPEVRAKISAALRSKSPRARPCFIHGVRFTSLKEAALAHGVSSTTIARWLRLTEVDNPAARAIFDDGAENTVSFAASGPVPRQKDGMHYPSDSGRKSRSRECEELRLLRGHE